MKEFLVREYIGNKKSLKTISKEIGKSVTFIINRMNEYGFEVIHIKNREVGKLKALLERIDKMKGARKVG